MTTVYFVRHAQPNFANHDDAARELTAQGLVDRKWVTAFLWDEDIAAVLSSPYKRAVDTVGEFACLKGLPIGLVDGFRERKMADGWIEDFGDYCKKQWEDFDFKLSDGESLREVQARNLAALEYVLEEYAGKNVVIGSHGTALSTVIHHFDPSFGFAGFERIKDRMPWIAAFTFEGHTFLGMRDYCLPLVAQPAARPAP